jgi:hypothetical protein
MILLALGLAAAPPAHGPWEKYQASRGPYELLVGWGAGDTPIYHHVSFKVL